jgi:formylglycine-generating enzyme required for sulfatase activity
MSKSIYINGKWIESESGAKKQIINPATGGVLNEVGHGGREEVLSAVDVAARAFQDSDSQTDMVEIPTCHRVVPDAQAQRIAVPIAVDAFLMGATPVTQQQYEAVMGHNPAHYAGMDRPVECVSWWDAIAYCNARSRAEGLAPCYGVDSGRCNFTCTGYRLPTSTEWLLAADVPTDTPPGSGHLSPLTTHDADALMQQVQSEGTKPVAAYTPNRYGLHDMLGNVWEWCYDYYWDNQDGGVAADERGWVIMPSARNPRGPRSGYLRVIRGGSFVTTAAVYGYYGGYRCLRPDRRSRFTGFRVARSLPELASTRVVLCPSEDWPEESAVADDAGPGSDPMPCLLRGEDGKAINSTQEWEGHRKRLRAHWLERLGVPSAPVVAPALRVVSSWEDEVLTAELIFLEWPDGAWIKLLLMLPRVPIADPTPAALIHWYDVDTPSGRNLGGYHVQESTRNKAYGYFLAQRGIASVAVQWWDLTEEGYEESMAVTRQQFPGVLGLGRSVWDVERAVDYLCSRPEIDGSRIGAIGHCLGGILTLYTAGLVERIQAAVACGSNCSVSNRDSNYEDYWYLGERAAATIPREHDQHELLALFAPRPFLMALGKGNRIDPCVPFVDAARTVYALYGCPERLRFLCDREYPPPSPRHVPLTIDWLARYLTE